MKNAIVTASAAEFSAAGVVVASRRVRSLSESRAFARPAASAALAAAHHAAAAPSAIPPPPRR